MSIGLLSAPSGSILQFSDGINSIPQIAGSPEIFVKKFESGIVIGNTGSITVPIGATLLVDAGTLSNSGIQKNVYTKVDAGSNPTSSLTTQAQWNQTGSFILVYNNYDHKLIIGTAGAGTPNFVDHVIRYQKQNNNTNIIMVSGSVNSVFAKINGQLAISSSDPYASIELIGTSEGWRIVSMYGTWT